MDQAAWSREARGKLQKTLLPGQAEARERAAEKTESKSPSIFPGQTVTQSLQGIFEPEPSKAGLGMLITENATARTTGKRQKNRKKLQPLLHWFGMGKTMAKNFCHICQKEKKTSC